MQTIEADVCVIGAGAGGLGAAITASRLGAQTVLVEREKRLGGTTTNAGVSVWQPAVCCAPLCKELYRRAAAAGVAHITRSGLKPDSPAPVKWYDPAAVYAYTMVRVYPWTREWANGYVIAFDPSGYDRIAREMLAETGNCRVLDETEFCAAQIGAGRVSSVTVREGDEEISVRAPWFIDCTGDVGLARSCGVPTRCGEDPRSLYGETGAPEQASPRLNGVTLVYTVGRRPGLERPGDCEDHRDDRVHASADIAELPGGDLNVNSCYMMSGDEAHGMGLDKAYNHLYRQVFLNWELTREHYDLDGYEIVWVAPRLGLREGPRIVGRYVMTGNDFEAGMKGERHDDIIAVGSHAMDTHGARSYCLSAEKGPFGIPLRCVQTNEYENLLVASRGASFSHLAASAVRLQRTIMELGIAAGKLCAGVNPVPRPEYWDY